MLDFQSLPRRSTPYRVEISRTDALLVLVDDELFAADSVSAASLRELSADLEKLQTDFSVGEIGLRAGDDDLTFTHCSALALLPTWTLHFEVMVTRNPATPPWEKFSIKRELC